MKRSQARQLLMQMLYEMDIQNDFSERKRDRFLKNNGMEGQSMTFFNSIYQQVASHKDEIDAMIDKLGHKWTIDTMSKVDVAILRLAAAELFFTGLPRCLVGILNREGGLYCLFFSGRALQIVNVDLRQSNVCRLGIKDGNGTK